MKEIGVVLACAVISVAVLAWPTAARADCGDDARQLLQKLAEVKDDAQRAEIQKLAEKAEKDQKQGRVRLCEAALARAQSLLK